MKQKTKKKKSKIPTGANRPSIFRGEYSRYMWSEINKAKTVVQLKSAVFVLACRVQELEHKFEMQ